MVQGVLKRDNMAEFSDIPQGIRKGNEITELPGKDDDTAAYTEELEEYKEDQRRRPRRGGRQKREPLMTSKEVHPSFWFIWEDIPGAKNEQFLKRLGILIGQDWVLNAKIEQSSIGTSMIVTGEKEDEFVFIELDSDADRLLISNRAGEQIAVTSAREAAGKIVCFNTRLCTKQRMGREICFNEPLPGKERCAQHPAVRDKQPIGSLVVRGNPLARYALPTESYAYWVQHDPEKAQFVDDLAESFRLKLSWDFTHPLINELFYTAVQMVTRDIMHNKAIEADFKSAIHDPDTGEVVAFKAYYLLSSITTFDARISQKLKDFGLLVPPSRTEDPHKIPAELELLWTPLKKTEAIDVSAKEVVDTDRSQEQDKEDTEE